MMLTEPNRQKRRKLDAREVRMRSHGPAVAIGTVGDVEHDVAAVVEGTSAITAPVSPADTLAVTFTSGNDAALDQLVGRLTRVGEAALRVADIESRLRVFAYANETDPSVYAELLHRAAGHGEPLNERESAFLRRVQGYLVGELNPAIYELQQEVTAHVLANPATCSTPEWFALARPNGVWEFLQTGVRMGGEEEPERVQSLFGMMQAVHEQHADFPTIDASTVTHPTAEALRWVGEVDPLDGTAHREYWETRLALRHDSDPHTIPNEIQRRTETLIYELEQAARLLPEMSTILAKVEHEQLLSPDEQHRLREYQAYQTVARWAEQRGRGVRDGMTAEER